MSCLLFFVDGGYRPDYRINPGGIQSVGEMSPGDKLSHTTQGHVESKSSTVSCVISLFSKRVEPPAGAAFGPEVGSVRRAGKHSSSMAVVSAAVPLTLGRKH